MPSPVTFNNSARRATEAEYPQLWTGLVGYWAPLLGPTGATLFDMSVYRNHGTLTNMDTATDWVFDQKGPCLDFDGINDVVLTTLQFRPGSSAFTLAARINGRNTSQFGAIITTRPVSFNVMADKLTGLFVGNPITGAANKRIGFLAFDTVNRYRSYMTDADVVDTEWHHVAAVWDGAAAKIYVDGSEVASTLSSTGTTPVIDGGGFVSFGDANATATPLNGLFSEAAIFNRGLLNAELRLLTERPGLMLEPRRRRRSFSVTSTPTTSRLLYLRRRSVA